MEQNSTNYQALYGTLIEAIQEVVLIVDGAGKVLLANQRLKGYTGHEAEDFSMALNDNLLFSAGDRKKIIKTLQVLDRGSDNRGPVFTFSILNKQGVEQEYQGFFVKIENSEKTLFQWMFSPVSGQEQVELALLEQERTYHTLIENLPGMVYRCVNDSDWTMLFISEMCKEITGYSREELLHNTLISYNQIIHPDDQEMVEHEIKKTLPKNLQFEISYRVITKLGSVRWVLEKGKGIQDASGRILFIEGFIEDVTEQRRIEQELIESEFRFRKITEELPFPIMIVSGADRAEYVNKDFSAVLGYSMEDVRNLPEWFEKLFPDPHVLKQAVAIWHKDLDSGQGDVNRTFTVTCKDGTIRRMVFRLIRLDKNRSYVVGDDVTSVWEAQKALRESEMRYRAVFEHSPLGIVRMDKELRIQETNHVFREQMGFESVELEGLNSKEFIHAQDFVNFQKQFDRLANGKLDDFSHEIRFKHREGNWLWMRLHMSVVVSQGEFFVLGVIEDITHRKKAVEIQESLARFPNENPNPVVRVSDRGIVMYGNPASQLLLSHWHTQINEAVPVDVMALIKKAFLTVEPLKQVIAINGQHFMVTISAISGAGYANLYCDDITDRVKAEEELASYQEHLEELVEQKTANVKEINAELERFAHSVSHDLRAPLRALKGFSNALLDDYNRVLPEGAKDLIMRISGSTAYMDSMILDLLAYSQLSRSDIELVPIGLKPIFSEVLENLSSDIESSKAQVNISSWLPDVVANKTVLIQILSNLISNAIKFIPSGKQPEIEVGIEKQENQRIRITVKDNGIGIAREHQERIFEIFERLHGIESYPGSGIGLTIVKKAAGRINGQLGLESVPGQGSAFWIELDPAPIT